MSKIMYEKFLCDRSNVELLDFLREKITNKSKNNLKSLLSKEKISVNNSVETKFNYVLQKGDIVEIKNNFITVKGMNEKIPIIYEDKDIIVIDKPSGLLSIGTEKEKKHTAYNMIREYLINQDKNSKVFVIHRLDKDTSGVIMYAKSETVKNMYQNNWSKSIINKEYIAVVSGNVKDEKKVIKSYLKENKEGIVYSSLKPNDGKLAITCYNKIKSNKRYTMLKINIKTGRKHQIRVHMKDIGYPIIGDKKYGKDLDPVKRLCLHASKLEVRNPKTKEIMVFEAKTPFLMEALL